MNEENINLIAEVRALIAGNDVSLALDRIKTACHGSSKRLYDEVILLESRFTRLIGENRKGVLSREVFDAESNRLAASLLDLVAEASRAFTKPAGKPGAPEGVHHAASLQELAHQQIIGINNLKQISWIEAGLRASRSVCRILTPTGFGTGFLVGENLLMTNNHVIGSPETASRSKAEFNYQQDESGGFLPAVRYELDPLGFHTSAGLDYSLVRIRQDITRPLLKTWGVLRLNANADPIPSEHVIVIQHPNGGYKQIVLTANWVIGAKAPVLHYTTDTMPGSSGSPVFNDSWQVVAIHHAGGHLHKDAQGAVRYVNEGVLMSAIRADAASCWPQ